MASYNGVEVTFLGNNQCRVTWELSSVTQFLLFKQKGEPEQYRPTIQIISGSAYANSYGRVNLSKNISGEIVLTYPLDVNLIAIGYTTTFPIYHGWDRLGNQEADALFDECEYVWEVTTPLSTPTGLYADNITSNSARTNWNAVENASNYKVQYKAAGDTVWTETYTD